MGVSSVTTYVESGAGVAEGARTGLASLVTAGCFVLTIFFVPLIAVVAQSVGKAGLHPAIAPALIMVGYLMIRLVAEIDWTRPEAGDPRLPGDRRRAADVQHQRGHRPGHHRLRRHDARDGPPRATFTR